MKKLVNIFLFLLVFQGTWAQDYDLYLCIGQSNMAGRGALTAEISDTIPNVYLFNSQNEFEKAANPLNRYSTIRKDIKMQGVGPAYSFSKMMATKTGRKIGLVVNARGGSSIQSWKKGVKDGYYEEALSRIRLAMKHGTLKAILWHQGETDASQSQMYVEQIKELVANFRKDLNLPDLFFVAGEIAPWASGKQASENISAFNKMISHISDFIPNAACVSSEGLMPLIDYTDPHFCTSSQIVLGERYAQKVLANVGGLRVLFIGDSITDGGWGGVCSPKPSSERSLGDMNHIYGSGYMYLCASYYQGNYPEKEYEFFNRGISGNTLSDLEKRWEKDVIEMNPDVLSILIGTNDIHHYLRSGNEEPFDFEAWERCYRSLLDRSLKTNPKLKIILAAPFVANVGNMRKSKNFAERDSMVRRCAAIVERIAHDYHTIYLPYDAMFDELLKTIPTSKETYWIWDGLHPTPAGHKRMADMWIERVAKKRDFFVARNQSDYQKKQCIHQRGSLANSYLKFVKEKKGCVAFLGGSITEMRGWRDMIKEDLKQRFPETVFNFIDAGLPSAGTTPHSYRFENDVLQKGNPDLLFVEGAVNDDTNHFNYIQQTRGMEGVVRHARTANPSVDIVMMHFIYDPFIPLLNKGIQPEVVMNHERVANYYNISSINLAEEIAQRMRDGEFDWKYFGGTHPKWEGHKYYAATINRLFDLEWSGDVTEKMVALPHEMPKVPIDIYSYDKGKFIDIRSAKQLHGWRVVDDWTPTIKADTREGFVHVPMLVAETANASLTLDFEGKTIGIFCAAGPQACVLEYSVDGAPFKKLDTYTNWSNYLYLPWVYLFETELTPGHHKLYLRVAKGDKVGCQIRNFVVNN